MQPPALEHWISHQVGNPGQTRNPGHELRRIQLVDHLPEEWGEKFALGHSALFSLACLYCVHVSVVACGNSRARSSASCGSRKSGNERCGNGWFCRYCTARRSTSFQRWYGNRRVEV